MKKLIALILTLCMLVGMTPAFAETAPATTETKTINLHKLVATIEIDIMKANMDVDLTKVLEQMGDTLEAKGNVGAVLDKTLIAYQELEQADEKKAGEAKEIITVIESDSKSIDHFEEMIDAFLALAIMDLAIEAENTENVDIQKDIQLGNAQMEAMVSTLKENKMIMDAVEATGSKIFDILEQTSEKVEGQKNDGTVQVAEMIPAERYQLFHDEIRKLEEYINNAEGNRQAALGLLSLLHQIFDDVYEAFGGKIAHATDKVDTHRLLDQMLFDIHNAVANVDMKEAEAKSAIAPEAFKGSVFGVLKNALTDMANGLAAEERENEQLNQVIALLGAIELAERVEEMELEYLSSVMLLAVMDEAEKRIAEGIEDTAKEIEIVNGLLKAVYDAMLENETLTAAIKATDSRLMEMLKNNNDHIGAYLEKADTLHTVSAEVAEANEQAYASFEAEIKKLEDYLKGIKGPKQSALDLLALLHTIMDDIHEAIDGHTHEDNVKNVDGFSLVGEMLSDIGAAVEKINLDEVKQRSEGNFAKEGGVYAVFEKVLNNISADQAAGQVNTDETLTKALETLGTLENADVTEEEAEAVFTLLFARLLSAAKDSPELAAEASSPESFKRASALMKAVFDTIRENEMITAAVEATGSNLMELLQNANDQIQKYLEKNETLRQVENSAEAPFIALGAEFAKVREYLEAQQEGKRNKALGLLNLLHDLIDDVHQAIDAHLHEYTVKEAK